MGLESGTKVVKERYHYSPYGEVTVLDVDYSLETGGEAAPDNDGLSDFDNELLYTGRRLDPETELYQYRTRPYHAQLGRFTSQDPIGYLGGFNLYAYVGGMPTRYVDPNGLIVYVVDGTTNTPASNTNAWQFHQLALAAGQSNYWVGPTGVFDGGELGGVLNGADSPAIVLGVWQQVCSDFCKAIAKDPSRSPFIDRIGYSRGGVIVATVARNLREFGCICCGKRYVSIPVRFVGLFDAVEQMGPLVTTQGGWPQQFSSNIVHGAHAVHTSNSEYQQFVFPTSTGFRPITPFAFPDGRPTTHGDLGSDPGVLAWMIQQAQAAVVPLGAQVPPPAKPNLQWGSGNGNPRPQLQWGPGGSNPRPQLQWVPGN